MILDNSLRLLDIFLMAALATTGWFFRKQDQRLTTLEAQQAAKTERLATLEAHYSHILDRLARIETKLDALQN